MSKIEIEKVKLYMLKDLYYKLNDFTQWLGDLIIFDWIGRPIYLWNYWTIFYFSVSLGFLVIFSFLTLKVTFDLMSKMR